MATDDDDPKEESIKVCCRFRPENQNEQSHNGKTCFEVLGSNTTVYMTGADQSYSFDRVFKPDASQKEVYDYAAKPIIDGVLRGFNGTVFAYGQTASGKTYTMEGPSMKDETKQGVIPRMVWSVFNGIYHADEHIEFLVKVSIVEIYNERIRDLLDPKKDSLKIHEDKTNGVFIGEVTESYVGCEQEIFELMRTGQINRAMAVTNMNEHSSRSHLVFTLTIEQKNVQDRSVRVGKLHLVDLAGSEKVAKTGSSGERLDEAKNINRSLSALGNVISALTDKKQAHVPYRDSKLTRVLQESLGGNAKTSLIITCSPSSFNEQETTSTLRFGQRAKMIKNVVKINHERSADELRVLLEKRDKTVMELRRKLATYEQLQRPSAGELRPEPSGTAALSEAELLDQVQELKEELRESRERVSELSSEREELATALALKEQEVRQLDSRATLAWSEPARRQASQTDQKLERLTALVHRLVEQNCALKVERAQSGDTIREIRDKYEKLLAQCEKAVGLDRRVTEQVRRNNIVLPLRGGIAVRGDG